MKNIIIKRFTLRTTYYTRLILLSVNPMNKSVSTSEIWLLVSTDSDASRPCSTDDSGGNTPYCHRSQNYILLVIYKREK